MSRVFNVDGQGGEAGAEILDEVGSRPANVVEMR